MAFIKEETEDIKIQEAFEMKLEDSDEDIGWYTKYVCFIPNDMSNQYLLSVSDCHLCIWRQFCMCNSFENVFCVFNFTAAKN